MFKEHNMDVDSYKTICIDFIKDISNDYKNIVKRYNLPEEEYNFRIEMIDYIVKNTSLWIAKYGNTIKKIDIIKDDGLNKMAGFTAGYPFKFHIYINGQELYTYHKPGLIKIRVFAEASSKDRMVKITNLRKGEFVSILSTARVNLMYEELYASRTINEELTLDARDASVSDIISITIAVEELLNELQVDKRALSLLIKII